VDPDHLLRCCLALSKKHELLLLEGAGGLLVPLTRTISTLDFALRIGMPIIVVARSGLGTLNHSLLTLRAAREAGLSVATLILNRTAPEPANKDDRRIEADNVRVLEESGGVEVIGPLPYIPGAGENLAATGELAAQLANILERDSISL